MGDPRLSSMKTPNGLAGPCRMHRFNCHGTSVLGGGPDLGDCVAKHRAKLRRSNNPRFRAISAAKKP
eukprot:2259820-Alexandrium_andersonii.AAC.1